jgi:hypothetical protein
MNTPIKSLPTLAFLTLAILSPAPAVRGWGGPHITITEAALATLPEWQKAFLGEELSRLGRQYCLIPDRVFEDKAEAKFAMMDSRPGVTYLVILHLPASQAENFEVLRYFIAQAVAAFAQGRTADGARFAGTLVHALEDWGCPAHAVPGDNMFTLFQQFLPPPEEFRDVLLHSPVESGNVQVSLPDYQPRLLGASVDEMAFRLLQRAHESILNARAQVIPIIQGLYGGDSRAVTAAQLKVATVDAMVVADALHTLLCLAQKQFPADAPAVLQDFDLSAATPLEATNLFMPQSAFFSRPYWGYAKRGVILRDGKQAVGLKLRLQEAEGIVAKEFPAGMGAGTRSSLSYLVPPGVFQRFEVWAGLHCELGAAGNVEFEVMGNGALLASTGPMNGDAPAVRLSVPLAGITTLQLIAKSAGGDGKGNYAVWGAPRLVKP